MRLRLFADHCVSNKIVKALRDLGCDVILLREHLPTDAPDGQVIRKAVELDAILLSLNGDFADIVAYPPSSFHGIIALQIKNHPEVTPHILARLIKLIESDNRMQFFKGKLFVVEAHRIRTLG